MYEFNVTWKLTQADVDRINSYGTDVLVIFKNTKGQDSSIFRKINPNVKIRIIGGLDEKQKPKYNMDKYYNRTIYTPLEVAAIISEFEKLEAGIQPNWSDLEKALYVYLKLADSIIYEYDTSPRDMSSSLNGLINKKAVCAGYSMIYKEAMDRLGIECEYINKQHTHAWNAIKIKGVYYPVDLTWEANQRQKGQNDRLHFFACDPRFSEDFNHQPDDAYEMKVPSRCLPTEEIINAYTNIMKPNVKNKIWRQVRENNTVFYLSQVGKTDDGLFMYAYAEGDANGRPGEIHILYSELDLSMGQNLSLEHRELVKNILFSTKMIDGNLKGNNGYVGTIEHRAGGYCQVSYINRNVPLQASFVRDNGTSFVVVDAKAKSRDGVNAYRLLEFNVNPNNGIDCQDSLIYSEDDFIAERDPERKRAVANILLTRERIDQKAKDVGGYVGYTALYQGRWFKHFNPDKEKNIGNYNRSRQII